MTTSMFFLGICIGIAIGWFLGKWNAREGR